MPIVPTFLGDDGTGLHGALRDGADAIVFVALGAGHVAPAVLEALRAAAAQVPVAVTLRPQHGLLLRETYGFEGAEGDVRASGALMAGSVSAQAARMILLAGLGGGASHGRRCRRCWTADLPRRIAVPMRALCFAHRARETS